MKKRTLLLFIFSLQEAFISLFPYLLLRATSTLIVVFNGYIELVDPEILSHNVGLMYDIFPLLLLLSISLHLAKNFSFHQIGFTLSSLFFFAISSGFFHMDSKDTFSILDGSLFYSFTIPFTLGLIVYTAKNTFPAFKLQTSGRKLTFNAAVNYIPLYLSIMALSIINEEYFFNIKNTTVMIFSKFSLEVQALFHLVISHILWLFGIHGTTSYRYLFDMDFYTQTIFQNLPYDKFFSAFVIFGGAGSALSLIIAIVLFSKDKHSLVIAKSSIPFSIFNINEPLIYGLPIAFSKQYIFPFIFVPLVNFLLSLILLNFGLFTFVDANVPWTTPPILSGYLLSGSIFGGLWQLVLIMIGVFIYRPYVKKSSSWYDTISDINKQLSGETSSSLKVNDFDLFQEYQQISKNIDKMDLELKQVISGDLTMHYQPQINLKDNTIYGYEALIRLVKDGQTYPPIFLSSIEKAGLETILDIWTFKQIKKDIDQWRTMSQENPLISINAYPKTLLDSKNIDLLIELFSGYRIKIELLEKGFSKNFKQINSSLKKLIDAGFEVAVDDFGSDEANLSALGLIQCTSIKLDKSLLDHCTNKNGLILFNSSCETFKSMGFHIVSEGVETQEQLELVKKAKVDVVQGWYYSKALPLDLAVKYTLDR